MFPRVYEERSLNFSMVCLKVVDTLRKKRIWIKYKGKKYAWCNHVAIVVHTEKGRRVIDPASGPKAVTVAQWKKNIHLQDDVFKVRFLPGYRYCNPLERQKYFETKATPFANCPFRDDAFEKTKSELILQREEAKLETPQLAKACQ